MVLERDDTLVTDNHLWLVGSAALYGIVDDASPEDDDGRSSSKAGSIKQTRESSARKPGGTGGAADTGGGSSSSSSNNSTSSREGVWLPLQRHWLRYRPRDFAADRLWADPPSDLDLGIDFMEDVSEIFANYISTEFQQMDGLANQGSSPIQDDPRVLGTVAAASFVGSVIAQSEQSAVLAALDEQESDGI